jgi:hypothetical protein
MLTATIGQLASAVATGDTTSVVDRLCDLVPECVPPLRNRRSGGDAEAEVTADRAPQPIHFHPMRVAAS